MANNKLILANADLESLIGNLRGEVGEVITTWLLMRNLMANANQLRSDSLKADSENRDLKFLDILANKLSDELVGRLSELAEHKVGQLTFHFAASKLSRFHGETRAFNTYIIKTGIRDKRNRDVSHKQAPGQISEQRYLHIQYRVLLRAVALALRLMKRIDREVIGPASVFLWQKARAKRYNFTSPPRAGYLLVPYMNLSPEERLIVVQQEIAEEQDVWTMMSAVINGQASNIPVCKKWGVILLGDQAVPLGSYPLIKLDKISTKSDHGTLIAPK
jgi:hypothetical protein